MPGMARGGMVIFLLTCAAATGCGSPPPPAPAATTSPRRVFTPRPLRDITVPRTPERIARGKYLSEGLLQCFICHSERDWSQPGAPPITATRGAGAVWPGRPWLVAANLTPDSETGIGRWSDDMLLRAIREGIGHDGRVLHPQMWYGSFRALADDDAESVVAYLRSLKPIRHALTAAPMPPDEAKRLRVPEPITTPVVHAPPTDAVQRGRRLASLADCAGCHTSWYTPKNPGRFAGGNLIERGAVKTWSSNLTSDPSGLAHYDEAFFREVMRTGRAKGRELSATMPWNVFRHLNDEDLDALFAYLRALTPVKHVIDNIDTPTKCAICGGEHPLGRYNVPRDRTLVAADTALVTPAIGTYRFEDGFEIRVLIDRGKAKLGFRGNNTCDLVTENQRVFQCSDTEKDQIAFGRDASGTVTHIMNNGTDRGEKIR